MCGTGKQLVVINNKEDNDFIRDEVIEGQDAWIGFYRDSRYVSWKWVDGKTNSYLNWDSSQPNNHKDYYYSKDQNCVTMFGRTHYGAMGKWNDLGCNEKEFYVCQKKL